MGKGLKAYFCFVFFSQSTDDYLLGVPSKALRIRAWHPQYASSFMPKMEKIKPHSEQQVWVLFTGISVFSKEGALQLTKKIHVDLCQLERMII